jgi:predicted PurR-regulated permease PerM
VSWHFLFGGNVNKTDPRGIILWFFLAVFIVSCILLGWLLWPFISVIVLATVISGVFNPVYRAFNNKINPTLSSLLTCLIIFFVLFIPVTFFVGILANEAYDLYLSARETVQSMQIRDMIENSELIAKANEILDNFNIKITAEQITNVVSEIGRTVGFFLYDQLSSITANVLSFIVNFFFMLLIIFYLLIDNKRLAAFIVGLSPLPDDQDRKLIQKFKDMSGAILIGNGLGGLIQGMLGGCVFWLFGLKSPFVWGVVMALLAFLPIVGIGAVFIPAAVYLFITGRIAAGIFFLVFYLVLSGSIEYFFKPKLVGKRVQMHTLLVFLSIIGGLKLFGILGIIYGPLVVTAFLTLADIYEASYQKLVEPFKE